MLIADRSNWPDHYSTFQPSYILAAGWSNQDPRLKWLSYYTRLSILPQWPSSFMPGITRVATNLVYFPCRLCNYLSHTVMLVQRDNSHLRFVRRHWVKNHQRSLHRVTFPRNFFLAPFLYYRLLVSRYQAKRRKEIPSCAYISRKDARDGHR